MKALGIDFGERKFGLSLSAGNLALPWQILKNFKDEQEVINILQQIIITENISVVVIGNPLSLSGAKGRQAQQVDDFIANLQAVITVPVVSIDERMTSGLAQKLGAGKNDDSVAATQILQTYLDKQHII
jgi:putative Holliday junction resolvase